MSATTLLGSAFYTNVYFAGCFIYRMLSSGQGCLTSARLSLGSEISLLCRPVLCISNIPGLYSLDATGKLSPVVTKMAPDVPWGVEGDLPSREPLGVNNLFVHLNILNPEIEKLTYDNND